MSAYRGQQTVNKQKEGFAMKIGLLGFGVVGRGVYDILAERKDISVGTVLCRRDLGELTARTTRDMADIIADPEIDTVVEVMGGLHPAFEYVSAALQAGKNVVTSNKHLLCHYYQELNKLAQEHGAVSVGFEAFPLFVRDPCDIQSVFDIGKQNCVPDRQDHLSCHLVTSRYMFLSSGKLPVPCVPGNLLALLFIEC